MTEPLAVRSMGAGLIQEQTRSVDFIASTDAVDSYEEVVEQKWRLDRFRSNPVVLYAHNSRELPIGTCERVDVIDGRLHAKIRFVDAAANPLAEQVWQGIQQGSLRAVSVGFVPGQVRAEKRGDRDVFVLTDNELHEISVVPIPANHEALMRMRAKATEQFTAASERGTKEKENMTDAEKAALESKYAVQVTENATLQSKLDTAIRERAVIEAQNTTLVQQRDKAVADHAAVSSKMVERDVDAIVGVKILPAERDAFVELAKSNPELFTKMVAQRADLKILERAVPHRNAAPQPTEKKAGEDFAALVDAAPAA